MLCVSNTAFYLHSLAFTLQAYLTELPDMHSVILFESQAGFILTGYLVNNLKCYIVSLTMCASNQLDVGLLNLATISSVTKEYMI